MGCHAHQAGVLPVLHVADQDAVLDQRGRLGGRALVVDGERAAPVGDGAVVDHGDAGRGDALAHEAGEGALALAVEIALEPVADRLVQQDARPAGAEHHVEGARRRRHGVEVDQRLAQRLVDGELPLVGGDERAEALAPAHAVGAGLLPVAVADDHRDVDPHHRPHVAHEGAVGAQDLDLLVGTAERGGDLAHARVAAARIGVDLFQQLDLLGEGRAAERALVAVERPVGAARRLGVGALVAGLHRLHRIAGAADGGLGNLAGMGVALRFAGHRPQAEALVGVEARRLQPAVVEEQALGLGVLQVELAVVGAAERIGDRLAGGLAVKSGAVENAVRLVGHGRS